MTLLERLVDKQKTLGLSDRKFAILLGVSDTMWLNTRRELRPIRFEVLAGAVRAFPQDTALRQEVLRYLETSQRSSEATALDAAPRSAATVF